MSRKRSSKSVPKKSKRNISPYKSRSNKKRSRKTGKIPKLNIETMMEMAIIFTCEEHDYSRIRGLNAADQIFLVLCLMYLNLEEMDKEYKQNRKK